MTDPADVAEIVLDDLAAPRFSPEAAAVFEMAAPMADQLTISPDAILGQASAELGLDDFGPDGFREPLAVLCRALNEEAGLSPFGVINLHTQLLQSARNRLLVEDHIRRHPETLDLDIAAPIIIAGLPRTGTTHLHQLLAADPALRSLPYWESLEPVPVPGEQPGPDGRDPRLVRAEGATAFMDLAMPHFKAMHEMTPEHVHEEIQLLAIDFSTMLFETQALMPSYRDWFLGADQTPHYRYLKRALQVLTHLRGGERWVLKSPQHLAEFPALREVFPDATVVVTHREPVAVVTSMLVMLAYSGRLMVDRPDPLEIARYWVPRLDDLLGGCLRDRDLLPDDQSIDVEFTAFMADDLATVAAIYEVAGQPLDATARAAQAAYLAEHRRNRHGRVRYELEPFGVSAGELAERFAPYRDRFVSG